MNLSRPNLLVLSVHNALFTLSQRRTTFQTSITMFQEKSTAAPVGIAVHDKYGLLIEAPGHTDSSFLGNNRKKND
jgi:hypothetical protein